MKTNILLFFFFCCYAFLCAFLFWIDYDYDYYGYSDYRGGYNDYYEDYYGYEDYYYDYSPAPMPAARAGGRVRPGQPPVGDL